jgi:hypothetical protein
LSFGVLDFVLTTVTLGPFLSGDSGQIVTVTFVTDDKSIYAPASDPANQQGGSAPSRPASAGKSHVPLDEIVIKVLTVPQIQSQALTAQTSEERCSLFASDFEKLFSFPDSRFTNFFGLTVKALAVIFAKADEGFFAEI